jgi:non-homologous end joining protein Ku
LFESEVLKENELLTPEWRGEEVRSIIRLAVAEAEVEAVAEAAVEAESRAAGVEIVDTGLNAGEAGWAFAITVDFIADAA